MSIHHATLAKAEKLGFLLTEENGLFTAAVGDAMVTGDDAKVVLKALEVARPYLVEYPWFVLGFSAGVFTLVCETVGYAEEGDDIEAMYADALEAVPEAPEGFEEPEESDDEKAGSIVPPKYRNEYKARGDATRCSDEFCELVDPWVMLQDGKKVKGSVEKTQALAVANGITKDWPNLNPGQRNMNWRNMLRTLAIKNGKLHVPAELGGPQDITFSPAWVEEQVAKRHRSPQQ